MSLFSRFLPTFVLAFFCLTLAGAMAQSGSAAGDLYFDGFQAWKAGEKLEQEGNKQAALQRYLEAHKSIQTVAQTYPDWQPDVVLYRLKNVEQALSRLGYNAAAAPALAPAPPAAMPGFAPAPSTPAPFVPVPAPGVASAPAPPGMSNPLDIINQQFQSLQQQNAAKDQQLNDMAAKMKGYEAFYLEALKARQKAEGDRDALIQQMQTLNDQATKLAKDSDAKDAAAQKEIQRLRNESRMVADMLTGRTKQFEDSSKVIDSLKKEKEALIANQKKLEEDLAKARSAPAMSAPGDMGKLLAENTRLKQELETARKQVETLKTEGTKKDTEIAALKTQVTGIQTEIAKLRQENTAYQTQVAELTVKLKEMNSDLQKPGPRKPDSQLAKENDTLRAIIMRHLRQQQRLLASKEIVIAEMKKLETGSQTLIENLEDMTSGRVRITVDEESLFTEPELKIIIASTGGVNATLEANSTKAKPSSAKSGASKTAGTSITTEEKLMVEADQALQSEDYKAADKALQDALRANPKNTTALISLAGIRLQDKKHVEAEVLLQKCLVYEPDNAVALYRLGVCQFQQNRLPDALATFEKCAQKDKKNARAHHYLGIIANAMSNRPRAEAEFKSALAIDPEYGDAYFNLAVFYATSSPPDLDKARENYRNALQRGIGTDAALEKLLNGKGAAAPQVQEKTAAR